MRDRGPKQLEDKGFDIIDGLFDEISIDKQEIDI